MPRDFGEEGKRLSYGSYLKVPELLRLQVLLSDPPAHDELLFITVHQAYELWFKQALFELESARGWIDRGEVLPARHVLRRVHAIELVMIDHIEVLETMSPQAFLEFRHNLAPASGFQSVQFREIEFLSGLKDEHYLERLEMDADERARLEGRLGEPTLWDAFCGLLERRGLPMPPADAGRRAESLLSMARHPQHLELFALSEDLLEHDEQFSRWRFHHVLMVERQIGTKSGTGGSAGAPYLRTTLDKRFYPELWDLRSHL
ncbi:MAG TPA: tryptophan 2,3-dioxygenase family protein [Actinomycetota bacterium]|nr:tryptophan 2,3-dioxygenase family protein [Actinomycetota bacterium]